MRRQSWIAFPRSFIEEGAAADAVQPPWLEISVWTALQFTQRVALQEEALLLEVSDNLRLWGGVERLCQQLRVHLQAAGVIVKRMGRGVTAAQALAMLRLLDANIGPPANVPDGLPLHTLSPLRPHLAALAHMGCNTWGDFRALPRSGVARRFGPQALLALDRAMGIASPGLQWLVLPEIFDVSADLPALADSAPALLHAASRLLQALKTWLQARQQGALALEFSWRHELRRYEGVNVPSEESVLVRTAQPTQDIAHLRRLLSEHLARITLAAPANHIRLRLGQSAPWSVPTDSLLNESAVSPTGMAWHELIERLGARLGAEYVQVAQVVDDHRPETMQRWVPAAGVCVRGFSPREAEYATDVRMLPTWLVQPPRPLAVRGQQPYYQGLLRLLAGPQRLETGWWNDGASEGSEKNLAVRDYFIAHNRNVGLVWIYRNRLPSAGREEQHHWFLQGVYA